MAENTPIKVLITNQTKQQGEIEEFKEEITGKYYVKNENIFIRYQENSKASVTFKVMADGKVQLTRQGNGNQLRLIFGKDFSFETNYQTAYGMIPLMARTVSLDVTLNHDQTAPAGTIAIDYQLYSQNNLVGEYQLRLQFNV